MENALLYQVLLAIVALFFIFLTWMNTKTWYWPHVTAIFFVFCATIAFGVYASLTLKTRAAWIGYHDKTEKEVATAKKDLDLVTTGDPADVNLSKDSILNTRAALGRTIVDRGRVWRQHPAIANADGTFTVTTAPPVDPALGGGPPPKHNIEAKTVLFAFTSREDPITGLIGSMFYLGEFRATAVTEQSVTLAPALPLSAEQMQVARDPNNTWTLYEVCPVDGHDWFAGISEADLRAMIPQPGTGLPPPQYEEFIKQYLRDGQPADEVNDPPENIWIEVKFKQPTYKVQIDAPSVNSVDSEPFNTDGQAQLDRLRVAPPGAAPQEVEFKAGETAVFDQETAKDLIDRGIADKIQPIFRRKLADYELRFHGIHARIVAINDRLRQMTLDIEAIVASEKKATEQIALLDAYKAKLTADKAKVEFEKTSLTAYSDKLQARLDTVRAELSNLYRSNKALGQQLAELNQKMTDEINRRGPTPASATSEL